MEQVTVIVPLYNKARTIKRAIDSVLGQSAGEPKAIVVDDGSTDESAAIVEKMAGDRVRLVRQSHGGVSVARNRGIAEAGTELIALLDADDEWKPDFLRTTLDLRARFPDAGLWVTAYEETRDPGNRRIPLEFGGVPRSPEGGLIPDFFRSMLNFPPVCSSNVVGRKQTFVEAGGFPEGERLGEDWDTWSRIAFRYRIAFSPRVEMLYHTGSPDSAERTFRFENADTALARTLRGFLATVGQVGPASQESVELFLGKHLRKIAEHLIAAGESRSARRVLAEAFGLGAAPLKCARLWLRSFLA